MIDADIDFGDLFIFAIDMFQPTVMNSSVHVALQENLVEQFCLVGSKDCFYLLLIIVPGKNVVGLRCRFWIFFVNYTR